jgi:hypothetical protein
MWKLLIRYLRMHGEHPTAKPVRHRDGILVVAAVNESAELATLLIADMSLWKRGHGASATNPIDTVMVEAHSALIEGFGIPLAATRVVEWDSCGKFDLYCDRRDGKGYCTTRLCPCPGSSRLGPVRRFSPGRRGWDTSCCRRQRWSAAASMPASKADQFWGSGCAVFSRPTSCPRPGRRSCSTRLVPDASRVDT